jgi:ElaB protein
MNTSEKTGFNRDSLNNMGKDTSADLHGAIDKAAEKVQPFAERLASSAHSGVDQIGAKVSQVGDKVQQVGDQVGAASASLAERGKQAGEAYQRFAETGRGYVRGSPVVSLLVALAAGYGLSKLLGSRK